jgi:large subunit ribosomal protein L21
MYAVFEDGSRQYRVSAGDVVKIDYRDAEEGDQLELKRVLLYAAKGNVQIGRPLVDGARVLAEVVGHPSTKLYIQKFRKRKNYRRLRGHRQHYTAVRIDHILLAGEEPPPPRETEDDATPQTQDQEQQDQEEEEDEEQEQE